MANEITQLNQCVLTINEETPVEQIGELLAKLDYMKQAIKEVQQNVEDRLLERIQTTGQDITIGTIRYYAGTKKTTKPAEGKASAIMDTVLTLAQGDMDAACRDYLSSNAVKYGSIRKALEDNPVAKFDELFTVEEQAELAEGKPKKTLQKVDTKYLR